MPRSTTTCYAALFALATVGLAACRDGSPTSPQAAATPLAARGGNGSDGPAITAYASRLGVEPSTYEGNTGKDAAGSCPAAAGVVTFKVDGASSVNRFGYAFTVSGDGKYVGFEQQSTGYAIVAVLVKGGDGYNKYVYGSGAGPYAADGQLRSPNNGGGNVPTISHYVICGQAVTPPVITKTFSKAYKGTPERMEEISASDTHGWMVGAPGTPCSAANTGGRGCLDIPAGATRWLEYVITYSSPLAGTITENLDASKMALNTFHTQANPYPGWPLPYYRPATFGVTTSGLFSATQPHGGYPNPFVIQAGSGQTAKVIIDIDNPGHCGDRPYRNTVTLRAGQYTASDDETIWIWPHGTRANGCDPNEGM